MELIFVKIKVFHLDEKDMLWISKRGMARSLLFTRRYWSGKYFGVICGNGIWKLLEGKFCKYLLMYVRGD